MYKYTKKDKVGELKVTISAKEFDEACERAYEKNKGKYKVQGFRNGKAPRKVIEKNYGDTVFFDDAFDEVISKEYSDFLMKNKDVKPASMPRVNMDSFTADKGIVATLTFDLMPEVELGDIKALKAKKKAAKVDDKMVEEELNRLVSSHARYEAKEGKAENGDFVTIDFSGAVDGKKFEGGTAKDYRLELGSHTFIDGFEAQIEGMELGQERDINVTFPELYHEESLKGKPAVFTVKLNKIEKKELPALDDNFISNSTEFETLDEYKNSVKERLALDADKRAENDYENALIEEIVSLSKVELPHSLVHDEAHYMMHNFEHRLESQGMKLDDYLKYTGMTHDQFHDKMEGDAEKQLKTRLVLQKIVADNKLEATEKDVDAKVEVYACQYGMSAADLKKNMTQEDIAYFENEALMDKVIALLKAGK